jgi:hypothetical protein
MTFAAIAADTLTWRRYLGKKEFPGVMQRHWGAITWKNERLRGASVGPLAARSHRLAVNTICNHLPARGGRR